MNGMGKKAEKIFPHKGDVCEGHLGHLNVERVQLGQEQVQLPQLSPFYIFDSLFLRQRHPN